MAASPRSTRVLASISAARGRHGCGSDYLVIQSCSAADAFVSDVLDVLVVEWQRATADELGKRLHKRATQKQPFPLDWGGRIGWLADLTASGLKSGRTWQRFRLLLAVRNGLAHAEGELTRMDRGPTMHTLLRDIPRTLDIGFRGRSFVYGRNASDRIVDVVRELVLDVDDAVHRSHPHLSFP